MAENGFVTISIDDGHITDMRTAEMLQKYGLDATFYIPAKNSERPVMPEDRIKTLSRDFEIGAHTVNHLRLPPLSDQEARSELQDGKKWLEDLTGKPVPSFCYPGGKFNSKILDMVKEAGYLGARTCMFNLTEFPNDPFLWGVSTHASNHSLNIQLRHALLEKNFSGAWNFLTKFKASSDWLAHFMLSVEHVAQHGGIAHLYLHSWEIDQNRDWERLEQAFSGVAKDRKLKRVTNGELFLMRTQRNGKSHVPSYN